MSFSDILVVVDAKTRHLWNFCTPGKRPSLEILRFFFTHLKTASRPVPKIKIDLGGKIAKCSEVYKIYMMISNVSFKQQVDVFMIE